METERSANTHQRREASLSPALLRPDIQLGLQFISVFALLCFAALGWLFSDDSRSTLAAPETVARLRIDLNRASAQELSLLPGIGQTMAERILADRHLRGGFRSVAELARVHGIGQRTVAEIQPFCVATPVEPQRVVVAKPPSE